MKYRFFASLRRLGASHWRLLVMNGLLLVIGMALLAQLPQRSVAMAERQKNDASFREFADLISEIHHRVKSEYVEDVDSRALFEGAISGMFQALDEHSSWLPPEQQDALTKDTEGEYSGVGMHIVLDERRILTVLLPIPGGPAARAGVQPWDRVIEIAGESTEGIALNEAVKKLTGAEGSEVMVKVWRPASGEVLDLTLRRAQIKIESVFTRMLEGNIGYLRIAKFQDDTATRVRESLEQFKKDNVAGVIVDVRYNAGGLLERVHEIADMFLKKGLLIVSIKGRTAKNNRDYYSLQDPICTVPVIVLVNEFSASASEILAGAIQDNHRGVIIGPKDSHTYGKASVQTISELKHSLERDENGNYLPSGLRLTTAHYYTPAGTMIHGKGIKPDIGVELPEGHEMALRGHGLQGDPNVIEPGSQSDTQPTTDTTQTTAPLTQPMSAPEATPEEEPAAEGERKPGSTDRLIKMLKQQGSKPEKPNDEFHDIMLEEAAKYLKAILIFESDKKAA